MRFISILSIYVVDFIIFPSQYFSTINTKACDVVPWYVVIVTLHSITINKSGSIEVPLHPYASGPGNTEYFIDHFYI